MRKLNCPQCDIQRFYVKNNNGDSLLVNVNSLFEIIPVNETETLEGFDLSLLYCLGCSWTGSPTSLKGISGKKKY